MGAFDSIKSLFAGASSSRFTHRIFGSHRCLENLDDAASAIND